MADLLFVTGGARSGKSRFAERLAAASGRAVVYLATMEPLDEEVRARIARHQTERPADWATVEAPLDIVTAVRDAPSESCVLLDCLSLWVSNQLLAPPGAVKAEALAELEAVLEGAIEDVARLTRTRQGDVILVTNEVGGGLVPDHALGRAYRDLLGRANQRASRLADRAWLLVSGRALPLPAPDCD
jgi:adenosylcobinamide kinase/adenosylcobinamide-phosphate guanylyltransferase